MSLDIQSWTFSVRPGEMPWTILIHKDSDEMLRAEVIQMPGCSASGSNLRMLFDGLADAMSHWMERAREVDE